MDGGKREEERREVGGRKKSMWGEGERSTEKTEGKRERCRQGNDAILGIPLPSVFLDNKAGGCTEVLHSTQRRRFCTTLGFKQILTPN